MSVVLLTETYLLSGPALNPRLAELVFLVSKALTHLHTTLSGQC